MSTQNLWYYHNQLLRIIDESLEVSLVICNAELGEFTAAKIFDIFNQILPTGFVLNSGYWPFFNSITKQSLCICGRYGWDCRHFKHDYHWINLESIAMDETMLFNSRTGTLNLLNSEVDLVPITGGSAGYTLNIKLTFQNKKIERGRPRRKKDGNFNINPDELIQVVICSRYGLQREYYPALHTVMFQPSPFFHETYGTYFPKLLQARETLTRFPTQIDQRFFVVPIENMPNFSLTLQFVNMPVHVYSRTITYASFAHLDSSKAKKYGCNKGTQTEFGNSMEIWKYKELIGNIKPLWKDLNFAGDNFTEGSVKYSEVEKVSSGESLSTNITESIKNGLSAFNTMTESVTNEFELPTNTVQDKEYDAQWPPWGYDRVVARRRGRKKCYNSQIFGNASIDSRKKFNSLEIDPVNGQKWHNSELFRLPSYATILKTNAPQLTIEDSIQSNSKQWFDNQFPDLVKTVTLKKEERDGNFDIAEEFIKQETALEDIKQESGNIA